MRLPPHGTRCRTRIAHFWDLRSLRQLHPSISYPRPTRRGIARSRDLCPSCGSIDTSVRLPGHSFATYPRSCGYPMPRQKREKGTAAPAAPHVAAATLVSSASASPLFQVYPGSLPTSPPLQGSRGSPFAERFPNNIRKRANISNTMLSSLP